MFRVFLTTVCLLISVCSSAEEIDIFDAARKGDLQSIERYVSTSKELNIHNSSSYTPFILATYYGHNEAAKLLMKHGADACLFDEKGSNAYMGVAFKGHLKTAKWLLENTDCDINHRNHAGQTALMVSALFDRGDMLELFIKHGADPEIQDFRGNSAESLAKAQGLNNIIEKLRFAL